jgi:hypothetical protein
VKAAILAFLLHLPVFHEDIGDPRKPAQLEVIAEAVADVSADSSVGARRLAALEISTAWVETHFSLRIHDGRCASWECDHGRARGPWQAWRLNMSRERWGKMRGIENTREQALVARSHLLEGLNMCGSVRGAIAMYVGLPCEARSKNLDERFYWYQRAYRALKEKNGNSDLPE